MWRLLVIAALLSSSCSARSCGGEPEQIPDASVDLVAPEPEPERVLEASLDLAAGGTVRLDGGAALHVLPGTGPEGSSASVRLVPTDAVVELPHAGAAARIGASLSVTVPATARRPVLVEMPFEAGDLPGGLTERNVYASSARGDRWVALPCLLSHGDQGSASMAAAVTGTGSVALLADASHSTPHVPSMALSFLALLPAALGPSPAAEASIEATSDEEPLPLYVIDQSQGSMVLEGRAYDILETKERWKDGTLRLLAVRSKAGGFVTKPEVVASVLLAHAVRTKLAEADRAALAALIRENASFLGQAAQTQPPLEPLATAVTSASSAREVTPGDSTMLEAWQETLSDDEVRSAIDDALVHLELSRTSVAFQAMAAGIEVLDPSTDDGDELLGLYASLSWLLSRLEGLHALAAGEEQPGVITPPWHDEASLRAALDPQAKKQKKKPPMEETPEEEPEGSVLLEAAWKSLLPVDPLAPAVAGLLEAGALLLPGFSQLAGTSGDRGDWVGIENVLAAAVETASRPAKMAPPPETEIKNHKFSSGVLTVIPTGTDEDGRIAAYRWWFDDGQDQHVVKGKTAIKARLASLRSGSHDIFVAAIDDDGQRDPVAARLSFYMRRSVELKSQNVEIAFDAEPWNVNSEHVRSIRTFVRELEGPVQECADDHYRWGIDSGGKVTMSFAFSADKTANVAHSATIVKDTFKNKSLSTCIRKAAKKPRMRYNQDYRPAATVSLTFHLKPIILFFDSASMGGTPGPDIMGATLYLKCTQKALRKTEAMCDAAVRALPGPWDAQKWLGDEEEESGVDEEEPPAGPEETEVPEETGVPEDPVAGLPEEEPPAGPEETEVPDDPVAGLPEEEAPVEEVVVEKVVIPPPEFDAIEIHADCVQKNISITLSNCMVHLTKKRLWCVDSCLKKAKTCSKQCKKAADWAEDPFTCREMCWTDEAFPCAEHCAVKKTPLQKEDPGASW
ncbi:MAG: hypothetical protein JRG91_03125 [Deltaproteobacteria bacterium]|nr:hypothetical protein [Deltaproteobacteria bacterium]